jgi:ketosteroid isomerase-like protein
MRLEIDVSNADIFRTYLERFTTGDADGAAALLADDFTFTGPVLQADTKAEFLAGAAGLAPIVRGCVMHHQWVDGEQVASFYDFKVETPVGAGSIPMAEWSVVRDGKLVSSRLVFDTATMTALMPSS